MAASPDFVNTNVAAFPHALLTAALAYARIGIPIFPLHATKKKALIKGWQWKATTDERQIREWFKQHPDMRIATVAGRRSGLVNIDVDIKPDRNGAAAMADLRAVHGPLPSTLTTTTPSGGWHLLYRMPAGVSIRNRANSIARGVDVRGSRDDGSKAGVIPLPPSSGAHGGMYAFNDPVQPEDFRSLVSEMPPWLLFKAIFSRRQRERLRPLNITGPESFCSLPPDRWEAIGVELLRNDMRKRHDCNLTGPVRADLAGPLLAYAEAGIAGELQKITATTEGNRDQAVNDAALKIWSLLHGVDEFGALDGDLAQQVRERFLDAAGTLGTDQDGTPFIDIAAEKWERCEDAAEARDLSGVAAGKATAEQDFGELFEKPGAREKRAKEKNAAPAAAKTLITQRASTIKPEPVQWLWQGRLALGAVTMLAGDPGIGKSQVSIAAIAAVTKGGLWPCGEGRALKGNAVLLNAEDDAKSVLRPRLDAAGADPERVEIVHAVSVVTDASKPAERRTFDLAADVAALEETIKAMGDVKLVVVDPVSAYLGKADSHNNSQVRAAIAPIAEMAARLGVAVLAVTHLAKSGSGTSRKALHQVIGSIGFTGAARAAFACVVDPDDEGRLLMLHLKNNLAPAPAGLAARIKKHVMGDIEATAVDWEGEHVSVKADDVMGAKGGDGPTAAEEAVAFLRMVLANGAMAVAAIEEQARGAGMLAEGKPITYSKPFRKAKEKLQIVTTKLGFGGGWTWALPTAADVEFKDVVDAQKYLQ